MNPNSKLTRFLEKSFCNERTVEELKRISGLKPRATLNDVLGNKLFHEYLKNQSGVSDELETENYLNIYDKCTEMIRKNKDNILTIVEVENLKDLQEKFRLKLKSSVSSGNAGEVEKVLKEIQTDMCMQIQGSGYEDFIIAIQNELSYYPKKQKKNRCQII